MEAIPQAIEDEEDEEGEVEGTSNDTGDGSLAGWIEVRQVDYRRLHSWATKGNENDGWKVSGERGDGGREEDKTAPDEQDAQGRTYAWSIRIEQDTEEEGSGEVYGSGHDKEPMDGVTT